jgi:flagellar hook-length control protein FliK
VASHEFERNLEQNAKGEEQQGERNQEQNSRRRSISLSSLDELSGVMSEEEALVAQIMRDNGNTVDLTA